MTPPLLAVEGVDARYGRVEVLHGVTLALAEGEAVALLGANGAGKSTLLKVVSGSHRPRRGRVSLRGVRVDQGGVRRAAAAGIIHVPEGRRIFTGLTVRENLQLGASVRKVAAPVTVEEVCDILPILADKLDRPAGRLSGGEQQALAIARGFLSNPEVLLLDEPSLGLSPRLIEDLCQVVVALRAARTFGLVVVEQDAHLACQLAGRALVITSGRVVAEYDTPTILGNPDFLLDYLAGRAGSPAPTGAAPEPPDTQEVSP